MEFSVLEISLCAGFAFMVGMAVGRKVEAMAKNVINDIKLEERALVDRIENLFSSSKKDVVHVVAPVQPIGPITISPIPFPPTITTSATGIAADPAAQKNV